MREFFQLIGKTLLVSLAMYIFSIIMILITFKLFTFLGLDWKAINVAIVLTPAILSALGFYAFMWSYIKKE